MCSVFWLQKENIHKMCQIQLKIASIRNHLFPPPQIRQACILAVRALNLYNEGVNLHHFFKYTRLKHSKRQVAIWIFFFWRVDVKSFGNTARLFDIPLNTTASFKTAFLIGSLHDICILVTN